MTCEAAPAWNDEMPNTFAYFMLFAWPLAALAIFRILPFQKALIWSTLAGYLILPSATLFKIPMIPQLDKHSVTVVSALLGCMIYAPRSPLRSGDGGLRPRNAIQCLTTLCLVILFGSPILTALMNPDPIIAGPRYIQGLRLYDALSMISGIAVMIVPFLLARRYLNTPEAHREILRAVVIAGMIYSFPALVEVRLSPQLHTWIYGFFPHEFIQHMRAGGFRPVVFLNHGLMIGILFCISILSALALWRADLSEGKPAGRWLAAAIWLTFVLVLAKSFGALAITLLLGLVVGGAGKRLQLWVAIVVGIVVLFYPTFRGAGYVPVAGSTIWRCHYSEDRAQSLKVRLDNEDALLVHANQKPWTGWGSWGRHQLYDSHTGEMTSVTDGIWIILIGVYGWPGYLAHFGQRYLADLRLCPTTHTPRNFSGTSGLLIVMAAILIDFLPNAGLVPYVWMVAGALMGLGAEPARSMTRVAVKRPPDTPRL